ncbi:hypothetical protein DFH08DRAFT_147652 [Mycena albidolilacea]|uniref:Uncharacterized protein n=1 Tax=Mycena albidolilacea TaxID=1033008 RepID=A0AAD7A2K9_9AGAR|nr:hypothetical protein DFH08DRAFT_147652 [Mycena albidolilacea]
MRTLCCLELDIYSSHHIPLPLHAISFLQSALALDELGIIRCGKMPLSTGWSADMLTSVLKAIGPAAPLRALRFLCGDALPQARLLDLGPLPPRLKYIGWDSDCDPTLNGTRPLSRIYVIEKRDHKNVVSGTVTRLVTDDWMADGVLQFIGQSWIP